LQADIAALGVKDKPVISGFAKGILWWTSAER
jgi:hypothetical protein